MCTKRERSHDVVSARLETSLLEQLRRLARRNDRTVSAEIRLAVKRHLGSVERQ